jgi:hypothetical protein
MDSSIEYNILQEQLLQEAFLDSIKNYAKDKLNQTVDTIKDWKDAAVVFGKILSDEELLQDFLSPLQRRFETVLKSLYEFLKKLGLDSFINIIDDIKSKIFSLSGLKKLIALTGIGAVAYYVVNFIKSLPQDEISTYIKNYFSIDFFNTLVSSTALASWSSFVGVLQPVIKGVQAIYGFLKDLLSTFSVALKSNSQWATKLVKENKMNNLRELIRQAITKVLDEDNVTGGGEAYMTKFAFSKGGKNRATKTAEKLGFKVVGNRPKTGKTYEFVKYEGQDPINEVSYRSFNKTISEVTPERKISKAILGIKKRLREVNQIVDYSIRLRNENSLTTENYLTNSIRGLEEISSRLTELDKKIKNLKE